MGMKGFYFSLDAIMGLMLIGTASILIISTSQVSEGVTGESVEFDGYSAQAIDTSYIITEEDFSAINTSYREQLIQSTSLNRNDTNTIGRALAELYLDNEPETEELAENYLQTYRHDSGLFIEGEEIVELEASTQSSMNFMVPSSEGPIEFTVVVGK